MKKYAPGVLLSLLISVPSWFLGKAFPVIGGPVFAILIGMTMAPFVKGKDFSCYRSTLLWSFIF